MSRYDVSGSEGQYQPGSDKQVLKNLIGISCPEDMKAAETELLEALYLQVFDDFPAKISFQVICRWHYSWLGNIYSWAGQERNVNMSKPDIDFAAPLHIPKLIETLERDYLSRFSELPDMTDSELITCLAETHVEFILIHPFREGNGRIARLLMDVMAVKAGAQTLDYSLWDIHKDFYFKSIQAGRDGDYQHIERLIRDVLTEQE